MNVDENIRKHLKRQRQLLEYDFHVPEDYDSRHDEEVKKLLGEEDPETEIDTEEDEGMPNDQEQDQENGDEMEDEMEEPSSSDELNGEELDSEEINMGGGEESDDVEEVDVTELVKYAEEAKETSEEGNEKVEQLFSKFDELESKLNSMDQITQKIEDLEQEIEQRNPTDNEQLEMRSFDSYPYNLKLTDYWSEKTGYDATEDEDEMYDEENDEYILRVSDVENDYNEQEVKRSLGQDRESDRGNSPLGI